MDKQRELNDVAELLKILTIAYIENKTDCISEIFRYAYRTVGEFGKLASCLASENAYNDFYNRTRQDIRLFKRDQTVLDKNLKRFTLHQEFMYEHFIPASSFRDSLIELYGSKKLNTENIKIKVLEQRMCWITREENEKLNQLGYKSKGRHNFGKAIQAYLNAGIKIKE